MLKKELRKIIVSPQYGICVILLFILLMAGTVGFWADTFPSGKTVSMLVHFLDAWDTFGNVYIAVPLLATVPVTFLLHDELNSGYIHFSIVRAGKGKYILTKMAAGLLSGMLMVLLAELLFTVVLFLLTPGEINFLDQQEFLGKRPCFYLSLVNDGKGWIVYIIWTLLAGLYGAVFSAMAVAASAVARNKYVAAVVPFLIFLLVENVLFYFMFVPLVLRAGFEAVFYPYFRLEWLSGIPLSLSTALIWILASTFLFWLVIRRRIQGK